MNQRPDLLKPVGPASLAEENDFQLGDIIVRPSLREVRCGEACETVEPRVMQVFVALARANGAVVSRDELIRQCWGGRIVGEDAINRCVSKVRQLADLGGSKDFEIDTIPRVGYRLRRNEPDTVRAPPPPQPQVAGVAESVSKPSAPPAASRRWQWIALSIVGLVIVAGLAAAAYFSLRRSPEWNVAESQMPFISTPAIERYPAIAPDGTMIAYSAASTINDRQIYLRLIKGGDPIQLTHEEGDASAPAWSPDGRSIAYVIFREGHPCRIMQIPVPAGQPQQLGQCRISDRSSIAFDLSGRVLFFSDASARGRGHRLFKLNLQNGQVAALPYSANPLLDDGSPSFSPSGDAILYNRSSSDTTKTQVRALSLKGGRDRLVAAFTGGDANATWSVDGRTIFLSRSIGTENSLWAYPSEGGTPRRILTTGEYIGRLSTGPNGLLALEMQYPGGQLVAVTPHSDAPPKPLDTSGLKTWCVDYAPDGTFLATGWRLDKWGVWISAADGSLHQLLPLPQAACAIRWSPDGSRFAFIIPGGRGFDVPVMTRSGEPVARLHFDAKDSGVIDWTADGKSILTSHLDAKGWRIWRTDVASPDKSVPITPYGWLDPRVHGTMLFAEKDGAVGIWRIDGTPHRVTDGPTPEASDVYNIAGDRLIYSDMTDPKHPMFSAVSVKGGPKERLAPLPHGQIHFTFGVDPKSGDIVYTQDTQDTDIGLLRLVKQ